MADNTQEPHYDVLAAGVAGASATMLTLLTVFGSSSSSVGGSVLFKLLFEAQLLVLELALIAGVMALIRRAEDQKRILSHLSGALLIAGTLLLWLSATIIIAG
ncbi:MAG: hypothetical protein OK457_09090 [Thaumarchaeota archaeon]|nr:hypothetical protein [Nitrososphaerota archaeon]